MEATQQATSAPQEATAQANGAPRTEDLKQPEQPRKEKQDALSSLLDRAIDEATRREAERIALEGAHLELNSRIALAMYRAGLYDDIKKCTPEEGAARAMVKIELGRTMGVDPYESMNSIFFVYGRPDIASALIAARLTRFNYSWKFLVHDDKVCSIMPMKNGKYIMKAKVDKDGKPLFKIVTLPDGSTDIQVEEEPVVLTWRIEQAMKAGLVKDDSGWKKYPEDMLFGKVIKRFQKRYASEIFNGASLPDAEDAEVPPQARQAPTGFAGSHEAAQDVLKDKLAEFDQGKRPDVAVGPVQQQEGEKPKYEEKPKEEAPEGLFGAGSLGGKRR